MKWQPTTRKEDGNEVYGWIGSSHPLSLSVTPPFGEGIILSIVPERAAPNRVDDDEEDEDDDVYDSNLLPVPLQVCEDPCLA